VGFSFASRVKKERAFKVRLLRKAAGIACLALVVSSLVFVRAPETVAAYDGRTSVSLSCGTVTLDNLTSYPRSRVQLMAQFADRGMATTDPVGNTPCGLMRAGDRIIATKTGLYWLNLHAHAGLLDGMWSMALDGSGQYNFAYIANTHNWSPNQLDPGSRGFLNSDDNGVAGLQGLVLPTGHSDPDTWVISKSSATLPIDGNVQGSDHLYQVTGNMVNQNTLSQTLTDAQGRSATMQYILTYRFRDDTANTVDLSRNRIEITLKPSSTIQIQTWVMSFSTERLHTQYYPVKAWNYSSKPRSLFGPSGCGGPSLPAFTWSQLCTNAQANNFIQQAATKHTLTYGDYGIADQNSNANDSGDRQITYYVPNPTQHFLVPDYFAQVWDWSNDTLAWDVNYFNGEPRVWTGGVNMQGGYEVSMQPVTPWPLANHGSVGPVQITGAASGMAEIRLLDRGTNFQTTALPRTVTLFGSFAPANATYLLGDYNGDGIPDLYLMLIPAGTTNIEVHILDGADHGSGPYQSALLHAVTPIQHPPAGITWQWALGDYDGDGIPDLYAIADRSDTPSCQCEEVHLLSGASAYQTWLLHTTTAMPSKAAGTTWEAFGLADYDHNGRLDVYGIKDNPGCSCTEVHIVLGLYSNGSTDFQTWGLHTTTAIGSMSANQWEGFGIADYNGAAEADGLTHADVYAIKNQPGCNCTEAHIAQGLHSNGTNDFGNFLTEVGTIQGQTNSSQWEFPVLP
jgi:hypothetical protein